MVLLGLCMVDQMSCVLAVSIGLVGEGSICAMYLPTLNCSGCNKWSVGINSSGV